MKITVKIDADLHDRIMRECKVERHPKINFGDRIEELILKGERLEKLTEPREVI